MNVSESLLTPNALVLLAVDAAGRYVRETGNALSRRAWVGQALVEELLRVLPPGRAARSLRRLSPDGRRVAESAATTIFLELVAAGWLVPTGAQTNSTWEVDDSRRGDVDDLWTTISEAERRAVQRAAQRTAAVSVAWSKKARATVESSTSTSRS